MPSGGNTPLNNSLFEEIRKDYDVAVKEGLQYEWLQWFIGGVVNDKLPVEEASYAARLEWDF